MRRDAGWRVSIRGRRRQLSQWFMQGLAVGKPVGIGFTMAILVASLASGLLGYTWLKLRGAPPACAKYTVWVG